MTTYYLVKNKTNEKYNQNIPDSCSPQITLVRFTRTGVLQAAQVDLPSTWVDAVVSILYYFKTSRVTKIVLLANLFVINSIWNVFQYIPMTIFRSVNNLFFTDQGAVMRKWISKNKRSFLQWRTFLSGLDLFRIWNYRWTSKYKTSVLQFHGPAGPHLSARFHAEFWGDSVYENKDDGHRRGLIWDRKGTFPVSRKIMKNHWIQRT